MIKVYSINKNYRPFSDRISNEYLKTFGIKYNGHSFTADILLSSSINSKRYKIFKTLFFWKKFLIWTNEPREDISFYNFSTRNQEVMNVYSRNVFFNNLHFLGSYHYDYTNDLGLSYDNIDLTTISHNYKKEKTCAAIFGYKDPEKSQLLNHTTDISLNNFRQDLATFLYKKGKCDIYGSYWPETVKVIEESGFESGGEIWWERKKTILKDYKYNLCFENTIFPYYCTEKLWHAIASGCLPIYYGANTTIYENFEEDSFIDASRFKGSEELFLFMENLTELEYSVRFNKCKEAMCKAYLERRNKTNKMEILDKVIEEINFLNNKKV